MTPTFRSFTDELVGLEEILVAVPDDIRRKIEDREAARIITRALDTTQVTPGQNQVVQNVYERFGLAGLVAYVDSLRPLPGTLPVQQPTHVYQDPKRIAADAAGHQWQRSMEPMEQHNFIREHGIQAFRALPEAVRIPPNLKGNHQ